MEKTGPALLAPLGSFIFPLYFLYPASLEEFDKWCEATLKFQEESFGEGNILSARVHMDEGTPHISAKQEIKDLRAKNF